MKAKKFPEHTHKSSMEKAEIVIYKSFDDTDFQIEVRVEDETVWLNRQQLAILFNRDVKTVGKHIQNALKEELRSISVVAKFATTATDGKIYQVEYYNLEMIISIGYRVKSDRGIQFRIWANKIIKEYNAGLCEERSDSLPRFSGKQTAAS